MRTNYRAISSSFPFSAVEGHPKKRGYMYTYSWFTSLYSRNQHSIVAKSLQSCPTLCDPIDGGSLLGCPIPGILQARTLEWVAISFSNA